MLVVVAELAHPECSTSMKHQSLVVARSVAAGERGGMKEEADPPERGGLVAVPQEHGCRRLASLALDLKSALAAGSWGGVSRGIPGAGCVVGNVERGWPPRHTLTRPGEGRAARRGPNWAAPYVEGHWNVQARAAKRVVKAEGGQTCC